MWLNGAVCDGAEVEGRGWGGAVRLPTCSASSVTETVAVAPDHELTVVSLCAPLCHVRSVYDLTVGSSTGTDHSSTAYVRTVCCTDGASGVPGVRGGGAASVSELLHAVQPYALHACTRYVTD